MEMDNANDYRLEKVKEIELELKKEIKTRRDIYKKYKRAFNIVNVSEEFMKTISLGMGSVGLGLFVIAAPIAVGLEIGALSLGALTIVSKFINNKLLTKKEKHNRIYILAEAKLNTIEDLVSKALNDSKISDEEFSLILKEQDKFRLMKEELRKKSSSTSKDKDKKYHEELENYMGRFSKTNK